jgi:hypothetical protein
MQSRRRLRECGTRLCELFLGVKLIVLCANPISGLPMIRGLFQYYFTEAPTKLWDQTRRTARIEAPFERVSVQSRILPGLGCVSFSSEPLVVCGNPQSGVLMVRELF